MGPLSLGSLFCSTASTVQKRNEFIAGILVAGSLLLNGCAAPSHSANGAMFRASSDADEKVPLSDGQTNSGRLVNASMTVIAPTPAVMAASAGASAPVTGDARNDALNISTNLSVDQNSLGRLRGRFAQLVPSSLTCSSASITGAAQDSCTVNLNGNASASIVVTLSSNNSSVSVPSSVIVAKNASSATFAANIAAVTSAAKATLTATANGGSAAAQLQLNAATPTLVSNTNTINFGNVTAGQTVTSALTLTDTGTAPVTISSISIAGSLFSAPGITTPLTLSPGQSLPMTVQFYSVHVSTFTGVMTIASNSSQGNVVVTMSGAGVAGLGVSAISCAASSMSGSGSDACTVTLTGAAPSGGLTVGLASNNSAVSVPASVTVPANASSAGFTATVASVTAAQSATLTATAGGASATFAIQLSPVGQGKLSVNATSISFGNVDINDSATQSLTLSSTGTGSVTVNSATVSGAGFSVSGTTFPLTLSAGQSATLSVQFSPTTTGALTGQLIIASNSSTGGTTTVGLSGTGQSCSVQLTWSVPSSSSDPIAGYRVYRATAGASSYQLLNAALNTQAKYVDTTVKDNVSYQYYVTTVDSAGMESVPSNTATVAVP